MGKLTNILGIGCVSVLVLSACAKAPKPPQTPVSEEQARASDEVRYAYRAASMERHKLPNGKQMPFATWHNTRTDNFQDYPAQNLHIIHRTHSSKVVALKTMGMLLGGGYRSSNKRDLKGDVLEAVVYQDLKPAYLPIKNYLVKKHGRSDAQHHYFPLHISNQYYYLVYEKFNKDERNEYRLVQEIRYDKSYEYRIGNSRLKFSAKCLQDSLVKPLAEWEADNYRAVHEGLQQYARGCAERILKDTEELDEAYRTKEIGL